MLDVVIACAGEILMNQNGDVLKIALDHFKRSVEITRDVRFQANLRLAQRQRNSNYMVSFLSLYLIAVSLIPNVIKLQPYQSQILLAISIILSVFVIFTSLIDGSQNFYHNGELLHQCARKVATVYHELKIIDVDKDRASAEKRLSELQDEYRRALDDCPINHENVDFIQEQAYKPHLFPANYRWGKFPGERIYKKVLAFALTHSWMAIHILAIVGMSIIVYVYVIRTAMPIAP